MRTNDAEAVRGSLINRCVVRLRGIPDLVCPISSSQPLRAFKDPLGGYYLAHELPTSSDFDRGCESGLDEIAIAIGAKGGNIQTILVESEREVNPTPSISHIQWLDMHDWKERPTVSDRD